MISSISVKQVEHQLGIKAKLVATGTLNSEYIETSENVVKFTFDNPLKPNTLYYIRYYNDDIGRWYSTFAFSENKTNGGIQIEGKDAIIININDEDYHIIQAFLSFKYHKSSVSDLEEKEVMITTLNEETLIYSTEYDCIEFYELPIILGGEE